MFQRSAEFCECVTHRWGTRKPQTCSEVVVEGFANFLPGEVEHVHFKAFFLDDIGEKLIC